MKVFMHKFHFCVCACTGVALFWISVHDHFRNLRHDLLDQSISQHGHSVMIVLCAHKHLLSSRIFGCIC